MIYRHEGLLRGVTLCVAVLFVGLGVWLMFRPQDVETLYPLSLNAPMAFSEVRAIFGGLMIGVGGAVISLDLIGKRRQDAAMVLATIFGGLVLARIVGICVEGFPSGPVLNESIFETVLFIVLIGLGAYRRSA